MALFNYATRELSAKIVYYGPGLSGKTTNIDMVHRLMRAEQKGRLISLPTETDRTLFFDFLPLDLGHIRGFKVRFHLYTVPGQVFYNATRRLVLQGVDGIVFVADSQAEMTQSNVESLKNLEENLAGYGRKLGDIPFVLQYNKRDLKHIASVKDMNAAINPMNVKVVEAVAKDGAGVTETLVAISRMVFSHLRKTLLLPGEDAEQEETGRLAEASLGKSFQPKEEPLEEISDVEEIPESVPEPESVEPEEFGAVPEIAIPQETISREAAEPVPEEIVILPGAPPVVDEEPAPDQAMPPGAEEIEIEIPERAPEAAPSDAMEARISFEPEGGRLTFLKFENPYLSPKGHAMIPAVFIDDEGNIVRVNIRIAMGEP